MDPTDQVDNENENRILYGRVLPYSFSNNTWSATEDDNFEFLGAAQAQVVRLNLYLGSERCAEVLKLLCAGETIAAISGTLNFSLPDNLRTRLGTTALDGGALIYRPAAYLLNRGAHDKHSLVSPHETAGAFSASIAQAAKIETSRPWTQRQKEWLRRIGRALKDKPVADPTLLDQGAFTDKGGFKRISQEFDGELDEVLHAFNEAIWAPPAA